MEKNYFILEAIPKTNIIELPNFHILLHRREDNVMSGHCLDFGIWAYSEQKDDKIAQEHIFNRLSDMVFLHIIGHLKRNTIDYLYANKVDLGIKNEWETFYKINSGEKIKRLRKSYNDLIANPDKLKKGISEFRFFEFSNLSASSRTSLSEILATIQELTTEKAAEVIEKILALTERYTLRIAA